MNDHSIELLSSCLSNESSLQVLDLSSNLFTIVGAKFLIQSLSTEGPLDKLFLDGNDLCKRDTLQSLQTGEFMLKEMNQSLS